MRTTLAFLGVAVPALLFLGWNLGWYNIVRGSSTINETNVTQTSNDAAARRTGNPNDNINFMQRDSSVPIDRPYLRGTDSTSYPR
ncbi:MAG TPA: hypothetical protein VKS79_11025 [Gemmataceae bacterium]|nr:hypothetical protein [Gemmataceae bacterium]